MEFRSVRLLEWTSTLVVVAAFLLAGAGKLGASRDQAAKQLSMIDRYLPSGQSIRAVGLVEIGMGLWLASRRSPGWSAAFAALALVGFTGLIGAELMRTQPLPCGCLPMSPGVTDPHAVRQGLWIGVARNAFLVVLCGLSAWLAPPLPPRPVDN